MSYDTTPDARFLRGLQNQKWDVNGALAELVDNGFGKGRGNAKRVEIIHDTQKHIFEVFDNGHGMDGCVGRLFKLGDTVGHTPGDIGEYGNGGTMALLWLADEVEIWTLRKGRVNHDKVVWAEHLKTGKFPKLSDKWVHATSANTPAKLWNAGHGTFIRVHISPKRDFFVSNIQKQLGETFAPGIRDGKELVWVTRSSSNALGDSLDIPNDPDKMVKFRIRLRKDGKTLTANGKIGVIADLTQVKSRVSIGFANRVITRTRDCYSVFNGGEKYSGTGVAGYIDLGDGWQPYMATTKNYIDDNVLWKDLMSEVFKRIRWLLKEVEEEELNLELDDLVFDLNLALKGNARTRGGAEPMPDGIVWGPPRGRKRKHRRRKDGVGEGNGTRDVRSQIKAKRLPDSKMEQKLCSAELTTTHIELFVNKDHQVVQDVRKSKANRLAFNVLCTREIADVISNADDILVRAFGKRVFNEIEHRRNNGGGHVQYVARLLLDKVRGVSCDDE